jgi:3-hydroxyisobutyrate dehydrogenase-like beta-hydroxyacid dehydrogenase
MPVVRRKSHGVIAVLHPGEMGAAVARCLTDAGHLVLWASHGRGSVTAARAKAAGLADAGSIEEVAGRAEVIMSICPPHAALDVARAAAGFEGTYVDANAISPATACEVAAVIERGGASYVDGGIIGAPPTKPGTTRLYLSGSRAGAVRDLFDGSLLDARAMTGELTAASAVKMAYAAWTKGTAALLLAVRALARADGVEADLLAEWALSQPRREAKSARAAGSAGSKGWRWAGEMEEIAASMTDAGLPDGFHQAAAEIFRRVPRLGPAATDDEALDAILTALAPGRASQALATRGSH